MARDLRSLTGEMVEWISRLIPDQKRDSFNTAIKMQEELSELLHALHTGDGGVGSECADILVLLLDVAYLNGIDLEQSFAAKMQINRDRSWVEKNGALKHETDR